MKHIFFETDIEDHIELMTELLYPSPRFRDHAFYSNLLRWAVHHRGILAVSPEVSFERNNFSNWFSVITLRDYEDPELASLYSVHELAHLVSPTPALVAIHPNAAALVSLSEDLASNESEVFVHQRLGPVARDSLPAVILADVVQFDEPRSARAWRKQAIASPDTLLPANLREFYRPFVHTPAWAQYWTSLAPKGLQETCQTHLSYDYHSVLETDFCQLPEHLVQQRREAVVENLFAMLEEPVSSLEKLEHRQPFSWAQPPSFSFTTSEQASRELAAA